MNPSNQHLSRRSFLAGTALGASSLLTDRALSQTRNPNVVMILADDLGYGDLSCYGSEDIHTPNIDQLAKTGARLTDYYCTAPVCSPTRCSLMTGRYHNRLPEFEWVISVANHQDAGLHPSEVTIAKTLQKVDYTTAIFGKWHLGYKPEFGPNEHGFDEFFGFLSGNIEYFKHKRNDFKHDLYENTTEVFREGYLTDLITEQAVDFIRRKKDDSFFLYVPHGAPHSPIQGPDDDIEITPENRNKIGDRATYVKMVERVDESVGQIVKELKRQGVYEETLIIFASDNGGERFADNGPLSGHKGGLREGGIRVPCIISWPGIIQANKTVTQPAITMDLSQTIMDAANVRPIRSMDGMTLMRHLAGDVEDIQRTFFWRVQRRDEKAVRWGKWKWLKTKDDEFLFNLHDDIGETTDIKKHFIDIVYELRRKHSEWEKAMAWHQQRYRDRITKLQ